MFIFQIMTGKNWESQSVPKTHKDSSRNRKNHNLGHDISGSESQQLGGRKRFTAYLAYD